MLPYPAGKGWSGEQDHHYSDLKVAGSVAALQNIHLMGEQGPFRWYQHRRAALMSGMKRQDIHQVTNSFEAQTLEQSTASCHDTTVAMSAQRLAHMVTCGLNTCVRRAQSSLLRMSSSFLSTSPGVRSSSSAMLRCFSGGSCIESELAPE